MILEFVFLIGKFKLCEPAISYPEPNAIVSVWTIRFPTGYELSAEVKSADFVEVNSILLRIRPLQWNKGQITVW